LINGDISNETPPRVIVMISVVADSELVEDKKFLRKTTHHRVTTIKPRELSHLWNKATRFGLSVELAAFEDEGWTQEVLDALMEKLDRRGANPFNYAELYTSLEDFLGDMPYRANLQGVIDVPGNAARFGSFGREIYSF
jgi:hypothetical protein